MVLQELKDKILNIIKTEPAPEGKVYDLLRSIGISDKILTKKKHLPIRKLLEDVLQYKRKFKYKRYVLFVGLQGSGKTTALSKYAYHYTKKRKIVGCIAADTFRAGAIDQLRYNVSEFSECYYDRNEKDPVKVIQDGIIQLSDCNMILIDTSGKNYQDKSIFSEMKQIYKSLNNVDMKVIYVADSTQGIALNKQIEMYKKHIHIDEMIYTKFDAVDDNTVLSMSVNHKIGVSFVSASEYIKRDLIKFNTLVKQFIGNDSKIDQKRIMKGEGCLHDLILMFDEIGPMMAMFPSELMNIVTRVKVLYNSMTDYEKYTTNYMKVIFENNSRIRRISIGSGIHATDIKKIMLTFNKFLKMMKNFGKNKNNRRKMGNMMNQFAL